MALDLQDRAKRASACYSAAVIYLVCLGLSALCWFNDKGAAAEKEDDE